MYLLGAGEEIAFLSFRSKGGVCESGRLGCGTVLLQPEAQLLFLPSAQTIESNWRCGRHNLQRIQCRSENSKGVYCLQYDDEKIISGLRDNSIKVRQR